MERIIELTFETAQGNYTGWIGRSITDRHYVLVYRRDRAHEFVDKTEVDVMVDVIQSINPTKIQVLPVVGSRAANFWRPM